MAMTNQPTCDSIQIESERLFLRRWKPSDHEPFYQMNSDSDVMRFLPKLLSREESDATIARIEEHFEESGFGWWALEKKETGEFIGFTGLYIPKFEAHFTPCVEVGWRLAKAHWKNGYATEAAKAALDFGFSKIGLQELVSITVPANRPSIAVMERLGMNRKPSEDFDHPRLPEGHELRRHVLYRLRSPANAK
jgi:RimJ/RimL family protein N-acetyltransferase